MSIITSDETITVNASNDTVTITDEENAVVVIVESDSTTITIAEEGPQGPTGEGVIAGGSTGDFFVKASDADYDMEWVSVIDGGVP